MKIFKLPQPKEADIQRNVFLWAQMLCREHPELELLNASMNGAWIPGGKSKAAQSLKFKIIAVLKKLGCIRKGYPDLFLPVARGNWHGLYIELKRKKGGKVSDDQKWWIRKLTEQGYLAVVARGFNETVAVILRYLKGEIKSC